MNHNIGEMGVRNREVPATQDTIRLSWDLKRKTKLRARQNVSRFRVPDSLLRLKRKERRMEGREGEKKKQKKINKKLWEEGEISKHLRPELVNIKACALLS